MLKDRDFPRTARYRPMIPIKQLSKKDCFRAALASILEVDLSTVPDFVNLYEEDWSRRLQLWLMERGLCYIASEVAFGDNEALPDELARISLVKLWSGREHAVVTLSSSKHWDPNRTKSFTSSLPGEKDIEMYILPLSIRGRPGVRSRKMFSEICSRWRSAGHKVVFTNGVFDLLHPGHIKLLNHAATLGDRLVVAINSDESVRRIKGEGRPILKEADRAFMLAALHCVDMVTVFGEDTPLSIIEESCPSVLVKGSDWKGNVVGSDFVEKSGGRVVLVDRVEDALSTTQILEFIRKTIAKA